MNWLLIVILVVSAIFFVWQLALFVRDLIKHLKAKKQKKQEEKLSENNDSDRKE